MSNTITPAAVTKREPANYETDNDGVTPLRMWSNARRESGEFRSAIHLVSPSTGDSLCGSLKDTGHGAPAEQGLPVADVITCKRCLRLAKP